MKKSLLCIFIIVCLVMCAFPFAGMIFAEKSEAIGNEKLQGTPTLKDADGSLNTYYLEDWGDYFETHYAFRSQLITADARLLSAFMVSNADTVTVGSDGWLYYTSTINDYIGAEQLSERGIWNLAHNIRLMQDYVEQNGADFLLMIPANKNSLYGDNMPYYLKTSASQTRNRDRLLQALEDEGVHYLDLFELFSEQDETLYLKSDSHWNNKGALLVYNAAMEKLGKEHSTYEDVPVTIENVKAGDLTAMIYPSSSQLEEDYVYDIDTEYQYVPSGNSDADEVSVEDYAVRTVNGNADGSLLMYRDSFANTLIPFLGNAYSSAYFTKSVPYLLSLDLQSNSPDTVIVEKVERNVSEFAMNPGIITSPGVSAEAVAGLQAEKCEVNIAQCKADTSYIEFSGKIGGEAEGSIYVGITYGGECRIFEAYCITDSESDYNFKVLIPVSAFASLEAAQGAEVEVFY